MIDKLEVLAIKSIYLKDPEYFYRRVCRYYSEKFHTPLMEVYDMPWFFVLTNYLEHILESNNTKEEVYNLALETCYPEKVVEEEEEIQDWIKKIEEEEAKKMQAKQNPPIQESTEEEISINSDSFSHLEEEMEQED
jgi:hypothetical protein